MLTEALRNLLVDNMLSSGTWAHHCPALLDELCQRGLISEVDRAGPGLKA